jgi:ABC-type glutathione transport system ATPase component
MNPPQDQREQFGIAYLFISHDLAVVGPIAHRIAVPYLGRLVEVAKRDALFDAPAGVRLRKIDADHGGIGGSTILAVAVTNRSP